MKNHHPIGSPRLPRGAPGFKAPQSRTISEIAPRFQKQEGTVLVVALVLLVLLTIIGLSASTTSQIEIMIAGNERVYKQNFYQAEGAAMEAMQILENTNLKTNYGTLNWLLTATDTTAVKKSGSGLEDITDDLWEEFPIHALLAGIGYTLGNSNIDASNTDFYALNNGITAGSSLDMGKSSVWDFEVYGRSTMRRGETAIALGYRKAY